MLKSINKQVVVIRDTGTDLFEEAFFIVNPKMYGKVSDSEMAEAARNLINLSAGFTAELPELKARKEGLLVWLCAGAVLVVALLATAGLLLF